MTVIFNKNQSSLKTMLRQLKWLVVETAMEKSALSVDAYLLKINLELGGFMFEMQTLILAASLLLFSVIITDSLNFVTRLVQLFGLCAF